MSTSLAQERLDLFDRLVTSGVPLLACAEVVDGARGVAFCAMCGGSLLCASCLGDHLAVRHHGLACDHCGGQSVLAHWRAVAVPGIVFVSPPVGDDALLAGAVVEVALSSCCAFHEEETRADVDALGLPDASAY